MRDTSFKTLPVHETPESALQSDVHQRLLDMHKHADEYAQRLSKQMHRYNLAVARIEKQWGLPQSQTVEEFEANLNNRMTLAKKPPEASMSLGLPPTVSRTALPAVEKTLPEKPSAPQNDEMSFSEYIQLLLATKNWKIKPSDESLDNLRPQVLHIQVVKSKELAYSTHEQLKVAMDAARYNYLTDIANQGFNLRGGEDVGKFEIWLKVREGEARATCGSDLDALLDNALIQNAYSRSTAQF